MQRSNPLSPDLMTPAERRAALCALLALGLVRLKARDGSYLSGENGDFRLHFEADSRLHGPAHP